jgi:predicted transcriptional regulator
VGLVKVLLSIKPEHAERIFEGSKKFEFRKAIFKNEEVSTVVVYATLPVGKVIGEFTVGDIIESNPSDVWGRTKRHSGISRKFFDEYFSGRTTAFAIRVENPRLYKRSLELSEVHPSGIAPQSFCYL